MTFLQQADHLVRHHPANKELMELGFGCAIEIDTPERYREFSEEGEKTRAVVIQYDEERNFDDTEVFFRVWTDWNEELDMASYSDDEFKILGKPPQLQHYLRVLGEQNQITTHNEHLTVRIPLGDWRPKQEVVFIHFDLTTGAPATEKDAEEFLGKVLGL